MITTLGTGYHPQQVDPGAIDKKALFNTFARHRYYLRKLSQHTRRLHAQRRERRKAEQEGKACGDFLYAREVQKEIEAIEKALKDQYMATEAVAKYLLDRAYWIDRTATLDEKAALLGLSTKAAQLALAPYAERNPAKSESFTMLLSKMPESHADPDIEWPVFEVIMNAIHNHPIAHRQVTQKLNEVFGQELLPLPEVPKPTLVSSR